MKRNRIVQLVALLVVAISLASSGVLLPRLVDRADERVLRYTNVSVEGAPPFIALGTMIGALRGLIVDYLWIKVHLMKEQGLLYEVMADAELITKLQPRFAKVWAFHGHNMAYNISVATHTREERWEWVQAGIRLVRNEGLRYNPNNIELHRELAFWFGHKIEGVADDAHLFYKREFCHEWHLLLGPPPIDYQERIAWIKAIADAPETLQAAEQRTPGVMALYQKLHEILARYNPNASLKLDRSFLNQYTMWQEVTQRSVAAKLLGKEQEYREQYPAFSAFDELAKDPELQDAWKTLIAHTRKRVLKDEYNMDPQLMYRYTVELGPIDWRHGQAHALYWSRRGSELGKGRLSDDDVYIDLNNDSQQLQAMQDLARFGRITFDPFSVELPGRFPDPRWIDKMFDLFLEMYVKHYEVRGAGGERFINFMQNFIGSAICEWYRAGETQRAQNLLDRLNELFGQGPLGNPKFSLPLDVFVYEETFDQYQAQPHLAPRDVAASLRHGFNVSLLHGRPEVLRDALRFAKQVTDWFKNNSWNDYETKFGEGRIKDIIGGLDASAEIIYLETITNPMIPLVDRMTMWRNTDRVEGEVIRSMPQLLNRSMPLLRALVYDRAKPIIEQQLANNELVLRYTIDEVFPAPPGLDAARQFLIQRQQQRQLEEQERRARDPISRSGTP